MLRGLYVLISSLYLLSGCELNALPTSGSPSDGQTGHETRRENEAELPSLPDKSAAPKNDDTLDEVWNMVIGVCGCSTTPDGRAQSRHQFRRCARQEIADASDESRINPSQMRALRSFVQRSTCGRADTAVTCCLRGSRQVGCGIRPSAQSCDKPGSSRTRAGLTETCLDACRNMCWTDTHCDDSQPETIGRCNDKGLCIQSPFQPNDRDYLPTAPGPDIRRFFGIRVVDRRGRPAAGIKLKTKHKLVLTADNNGMIAFYEPELMGERVYFAMESQRYSIPPDGLGFRGVAAVAHEGSMFELEVDRSLDEIDGSSNYGDTATELLRGPVPEPSELYHVRIIDEETGRGIPLAQLTHGSLTYVTDSLGNIAMMGDDALFRTTTFAVTAHGYSFAHPNIALEVTRGARATLVMKRENIAERLYRVTGTGRYRHTRLLRLPIPDHVDQQNGKVMGQDTVYTALYKDQIFWLWGDTLSAHGPLGVFHVAAARSPLPADTDFTPDTGVLLDYFTAPNGFVKAMAPASTVPGEGATWMGGLVAVRDDNGEEHLFGTYGKFRHLQQLDCGMARFNDRTELFERVSRFCGLPTRPHGHALTIGHQNQDYVYYHNNVRVIAHPDALSDPHAFELYTPKDQTGTILRDENGEADYDWRPGASSIELTDIAVGAATVDEVILGQMVSAIDGQRLSVHKNSTKGYSRHRQKYFQLVQRIGGETSHLGDIWYSEADTPMGPWTYAVPILQHDKYTFYNPHYHKIFDGRNGQDIYFEATYTRSFAGADAPVNTPRIDYNQFMYKLDLERPGTMVPGSVYAQLDAGSSVTFSNKHWLHGTDSSLRQPFMAFDRPRDDLVPVWYSGAACSPDRQLRVGGTPETTPVFFAVPHDHDPEMANASLVSLKEFRTADGRYGYSVADDVRGRSIAKVFRNPISVRFPTEEFLGKIVADAGPDQCLTVDNDQRTVTVQLAGSATSAESPQHFMWLGEGFEVLGNQPRIQVSLPVGLHQILLLASDDAGHQDADLILIQVSGD